MTVVEKFLGNGMAQGQCFLDIMDEDAADMMQMQRDDCGVRWSSLAGAVTKDRGV